MNLKPVYDAETAAHDGSAEVESAVMYRIWEQVVKGNDAYDPDHLSQPEMDHLCHSFRLGWFARDNIHKILEEESE